MSVPKAVKKEWLVTDARGNIKGRVEAGKEVAILQAKEFAAASLSVVHVYELVAAVEGVSQANELEIADKVTTKAGRF